MGHFKFCSRNTTVVPFFNSTDKSVTTSITRRISLSRSLDSNDSTLADSAPSNPLLGKKSNGPTDDTDYVVSLNVVMKDGTICIAVVRSSSCADQLG